MANLLRCAILDDYQNIAQSMADWSAIAARVQIVSFSQPFSSLAQLQQALSDCQIVVLMRERTPFNREVFTLLPKLQLIVTTGMRNAAIDLEAAQQRGIVVCGTESMSHPPVELTWALILSLARNLAKENLALPNNNAWQSTLGTDLYGKQLGIIGLGKIGSQVAHVGKAFGMQVVAWSQNLTLAKAQSEGVACAASLAELLACSDVVTIHLLLSERTRGLIDRQALRTMRPTAYLINTSRAAIVEQTALIQALQQSWIAGAGLDVFEQEPLPAQHALRQLPNVLATPHLGYVTEANYRCYYGQALADIQAFLQGEPIRRLA